MGRVTNEPKPKSRNEEKGVKKEILGLDGCARVSNEASDVGLREGGNDKCHVNLG